MALFLIGFGLFAYSVYLQIVTNGESLVRLFGVDAQQYALDNRVESNLLQSAAALVASVVLMLRAVLLARAKR